MGIGEKTQIARKNSIGNGALNHLAGDLGIPRVSDTQLPSITLFFPIRLYACRILLLFRFAACRRAC
jgi:hypothetical protein